MQIMKQVTVTIKDKEIIGMLVDFLRERARDSTDEQRTMYYAIACLIGVPDVEAVKRANRWADEHNHPRVTVDEFRCWLPNVLSGVFAEYMGLTEGHKIH
jgi:hypothetical protein